MAYMEKSGHKGSHNSGHSEKVCNAVTQSLELVPVVYCQGNYLIPDDLQHASVACLQEAVREHLVDNWERVKKDRASLQYQNWYEDQTDPIKDTQMG